MAVGLFLPSTPIPPIQNPNPRSLPKGFYCFCSSRREVSLHAAVISLVSLTPYVSSAAETNGNASPRKPILGGILNTKSWFQFFGDGFSIRVPPLFEDIMEPEDYSAGFTFYGDKVKPKSFAARFASPDGSIKCRSSAIQSAQDHLFRGERYHRFRLSEGSSKDICPCLAISSDAKIALGGASLYSARTIKVKEDETLRNYYFYEFGIDTQRVALVATVNSGKTVIAGATAPQLKWEDDGVKLRSAAISLSVS